MAKRTKKPDAEQLPVDGLSTPAGEKVLLWKATRPLSTAEHEQLSEKLRLEHEKTGVKIILVPYSVEAQVGEPR